jgi:MFS transporter, DHA1 family, staphyloferrin A biosynthesis exporter
MKLGNRFRRTFSSLKHRDFLILWSGTVVSHSGDWMDQIALNWLVLEITESPLSLGLVNLWRAIPVLIFTPLGGVTADRWERRRILMVTQSIYMVLAFLLGALVTTGTVNIWEIYFIAALRGAVMSFNMPARQSMISDLVPRKDLPNAVALNSATNNLTRVLGPSLGGVLIALLGIDWLFYLNGVSFLAILYTLRLLRDVGTQRKNTNHWQELKEGLSYIGRNKVIRYLVFIAVVPMFFGQPYMTMLAVFARSILVIGPAGLGLLTSIASLGAVIGALAVAGLRRGPQIGLMVGGIIAFGISLFLFSFSRWIVPSLVFLFIAGGANVFYNSTNNALIQISVEDNYRGRVLSMLFINRGMVPLGTAFTGLLAEAMGAPAALGAMSLMLVLLGGLAMLMRPRQAPVPPEAS